jgi:glutathione-specific gamma-glutamylcyclotransferase
MANMEQFWVFGYGSLMWNPGFEYGESEPALIHGFHRSLCVYSFVHRGTEGRPGLVLGLDRGGSCHGMAFRVEPAKWQDTLAYLRSREQVTAVYGEMRLPARLLNSGRRIECLTYVVDRAHRQYAGKLTINRRLDFIHPWGAPETAWTMC